YEARAGQHLPSRRLSDGRNVFEALGREFTLLAFDAEEGAVAAFEQAAGSLGVPLTVVRDSFVDERADYKARLILVRPDHYIAWAGDAARKSAQAVMAKVVGRAA